MIDKIANNKSNLEPLNLESIDKIVEKLNYYRGYFGKIDQLSENDISILSKNISTFFNIKPVLPAKNLPEYLFRVSINNDILKSLGKPLGFLTEINQLLAPPKDKCNFNRCNIPGQQVLYCSTNEATAYWETKPKVGDVITISLYKLKKDREINCSVIGQSKTKNPTIQNKIQQVYYILEEFFVDIYTRPIPRDKPINYLFSSILSSEQLFYPIASDNNIEAIVYPSVQRHMHGQNFAIRNDIIFEKYDLIEVTTRFIIEQYENMRPEETKPPYNSLIAAVTIKDFDFTKGLIKYSSDIFNKFDFLRNLQSNIISGKSEQIRFENPIEISSIEDLKTIHTRLTKNKNKA